MLWSEIKRWAKDKGYETLKDKDDNQYYWAKLDTDSSGVARSISKLATAIFNDITNNQWIDHQVKYKENPEIKKANIGEY